MNTIHIPDKINVAQIRENKEELIGELEESMGRRNKGLNFWERTKCFIDCGSGQWI